MIMIFSTDKEATEWARDREINLSKCKIQYLDFGVKLWYL